MGFPCGRADAIIRENKEARRRKFSVNDDSYGNHLHYALNFKLVLEEIGLNIYVPWANRWTTTFARNYDNFTLLRIVTYINTFFLTPQLF